MSATDGEYATIHFTSVERHMQIEFNAIKVENYEKMVQRDAAFHNSANENEKAKQ